MLNCVVCCLLLLLLLLLLRLLLLVVVIVFVNLCVGSPQDRSDPQRPQDDKQALAMHADTP